MRSQLREAIETTAAAFGLILIIAYISGRIYLSAYLTAFHIDFSDLGLSLQDVSFSSWHTLLYPLNSAVALLVGYAVAQRIPRATHPLRGRLEDIQKRMQEEGESPEVSRDLAALDEDITAEEHKMSWEVARAIGMMFLVAPATYLALYFPLASAEGAKAAYFGAAAYSLIGLGIWLGLALGAVATFVIRTRVALISALAVYLLALTFAFPVVQGRLRGLEDYNARERGSSLSEIVLVAKKPLREDWVGNDSGDFISPSYRLLSRNEHYWVVWNPKQPGTASYFALADITRADRQ
jgi:hypothetical protein